MSTPVSEYLNRAIVASLAFAGGLAVGMMLAPTTGRESRQRVASGVKDAADAIRNQAREATEPVVEKVREAANDLAERHVPMSEDWDVVDGKTLLENLPGLPSS